MKGEIFPEIKEYTKQILRWECIKRIMNFSKTKPVGEWKMGTRMEGSQTVVWFLVKYQNRETCTQSQGSSGDSIAHTWELSQPEARELEYLYPAYRSDCLTATPRPGGDINSQNFWFFKTRKMRVVIWEQSSNRETQVLIVRAHLGLMHENDKGIWNDIDETAFAAICIFRLKG